MRTNVHRGLSWIPGEGKRSHGLRGLFTKGLEKGCREEQEEIQKKSKVWDVRI